MLPRGMALVPDYSLQGHPSAVVIRKYHGWEHDASVGGPLMEQDRLGKWVPNGKLSGAFRRTTSEVLEVPDSPEYRRHVIGDARSPGVPGDLWPADEETAKFLAIPFWPLHTKYAAEFAEEHRAHAELLRPPQTGTRVPVPSEVKK